MSPRVVKLPKIHSSSILNIFEYISRSSTGILRKNVHLPNATHGLAGSAPNALRILAGHAANAAHGLAGSAPNALRELAGSTTSRFLKSENDYVHVVHVVAKC